MTRNSFRTIVPGLIAGLLLAASLGPAGAQSSYNVIVDTSSLAPGGGQAANNPFSIDFQLNGANNNTVTLSNFDFGGGGTIGAASTFGNVAGAPQAAITLNDGMSFGNEYTQMFTPGSTLSFQVDATTNNFSNTTTGPDGFSFTIFDSQSGNTGNGIGAGPLYGELVFQTLDGSAPVAYDGNAGYPTVTTRIAPTSPNPAPTPEFGSVFSLGGLLAAGAAGLWFKRRK